VIDRRYIGSASLNALEFIHDKDRWQKVGLETFAYLTSDNHISVHPKTLVFPKPSGNISPSSKTHFLENHPLTPKWS